ILIRFAYVAGELWLSQPRITQFSAADEEGELPIAEAALVKPDKVRLTFTRSAKGRLTVHNCTGHDPEVCLLDREGRPIVGFYAWQVP
ncbi:MAG: hypothetical protein N3A66_09795, partial [Planctomycetota bacterium]|nr:hypothetical protein [Planctomycetota bacterium]